MEGRIITVNGEHAGPRLDKYLSSVLDGISRGRIQELIKSGKVKVAGLEKSVSYKVKSGDVVSVYIEKSVSKEIPFSSADIPVLYQDQDIIIIDKPSGIIVHPSGRNKESVIGALLAKGTRLSQVSDDGPGVVHRLDKDTSGVMLLAKNDSSHLNLYRQFKDRKIEKEYIAVVKGVFKRKEGKIDYPLKRLKHQPRMKVAFSGSKVSVTFYKVIDEKGDFSLISLSPKTGRMHQLRVHLAFLGHPVAGDKKYKGPNADRLLLHAKRIKFSHPRTGKSVEFFSQPPVLFGQYFSG